MKTARLLLLISLSVAIVSPIAEAITVAKRTFGFQLGAADPYPSTLGFGMNYYFHEFIGVTVMGGLVSGNESKLSTASLGLRFMATREKISPTIFVGGTSYEDASGKRQAMGVLGAGLNLLISDHVYLGGGANFGLSPRDGRTEISPYFILGVLY